MLFTRSTIIFVTTFVFRVNFRQWSDAVNSFFLSIYLAAFQAAHYELEDYFYENPCPQGKIWKWSDANKVLFSSKYGLEVLEGAHYEFNNYFCDNSGSYG